MMGKNNKHLGLKAALAAAMLFAVQSVSADSTIALTTWWSGAGNANGITFSGTDYHDGASYPTFTENGGAGGFATTANGGASFQSWCVDIFHDFNWGNPASTVDTKQNASEIFNLLGADAYTKIEKNLERLYAAEHALIDSHSSTANNSAAFQLAVWEIVNEKSTNSYDLAGGDLRISSTSTGYGDAQIWLSNLNNPDYFANPGYVVSFWNVNDGTGGADRDHPAPTWGAQDVAVFAPIPEPETYAMMLAGLGLMGFIARRRRERDPL